MSSAVLTCLIGAGRVSLCAEDADQTLHAHVRSSSPVIAALIQSASEQSKTFKRLIDTINQSDGIVFVEEGTCGHGVQACFVTVTKAGRDRILWVKVDTRRSDLDLKAQIGHELRHTIEVLSDRSVTNQVAMSFFYSQMGPVRSGSRFETTDAIETGEAVRLEVSAFNRKIGNRVRPRNQMTVP